jgi:hypothetical protein
MPFNENGAITVFGFKLPFQPQSTIVASLSPELSLKGILRLRVEEIAPSNDTAASQTASLNELITLARGFTEPLSGNPANKGLKELLRSAEVTQSRNRVLLKANVPVSMFSGLAGGEDSSVQSEAVPASDASK